MWSFPIFREWQLNKNLNTVQANKWVLFITFHREIQIQGSLGQRMKRSGCSKICNDKKSLILLIWKSDNIVRRSVAGASRLRKSKSSSLSKRLGKLHFWEWPLLLSSALPPWGLAHRGSSCSEYCYYFLNYSHCCPCSLLGGGPRSAASESNAVSTSGMVATAALLCLQPPVEIASDTGSRKRAMSL